MVETNKSRDPELVEMLGVLDEVESALDGVAARKPEKELLEEENQKKRELFGLSR
jgi:hypothetical protein